MRVLRALPLAVWMVNPSFPITGIRPQLDDVKYLAVDRLGDLLVDGVNPRQVGGNNRPSRLPRPLDFLGSLACTRAIQRYIENHRRGNATAKVATKFEHVVHTVNITKSVEVAQ